jgi:pilus assembly protein Flp/PilA
MEKLLKLIVAMQVRFMRAADNERGATATEYALLVALIALVIVGGVGFFGGQLNTFFSTIGGKLGTAF